MNDGNNDEFSATGGWGGSEGEDAHRGNVYSLHVHVYLCTVCE